MFQSSCTLFGRGPCPAGVGAAGRSLTSWISQAAPQGDDHGQLQAAKSATVQRLSPLDMGCIARFRRRWPADGVPNGEVHS